MFEHCLYFNTTALARSVEHEWSTAFREFGLTPAQAFMLRTVLAKPGILQSALAESMAIARPTTTRALDALARSKMIVRRPTDGDGRQMAIHPTAQARAIATQLDDASGKVARRLKKRLGDAEFRGLVDDIRGARAALE